MSFGQPLWFFGFAFLPVLIVLFARNESRRSKLLKQLVAARLQGRLAGTVSLGLRRLRFALFLLGLAALLVSLTQPRYGYTWEESKRQGRDILIAIDCSRSMLATDVNPSRLVRAKLATQDLISQLQGDRVGLIAFEGTAFLQAPLTIDYSAVLDSLAVLDTNVIPRGGTNIAAAIMEADAAFGKGESDNRCLIIFTDGEELEDDAVAAAAAEKEHMRIFTVGLGSTDGSLIPVPTENGGTEFVKDDNGQFVKSRLDEDRLRKIAESTGGFYVHLQNGPAEMKQIIQDGLGKMKEKDIDARLSRRPIERYEWPLSAALVLLVASMLIGERKRPARRVGPPPPPRSSRVEPPPMPRVEPPPLPRMAALLLLLLPLVAHAKNSGLEAYEQKDYKGAMSEFDRQLQQRKDSAALNFDLGAAAYKAGDLAKALEAFAKAVTSPDPKLRAAAEYNLGNTLFEQGQATEQKEKRVQTWKDALEHYEQALKVTPGNKDAEYNRDVVRRLLEEMEKQPPKDQQQQQQQNKKDDQKKDDQKQDQQNQQNKNSQNKDQKDQQQNQQQQQQQKSGGSQDQDKNQQQSQSQQQQQQSQSQQSQGSSGQQQQQQKGQQGNAQQDKDQQNGKDGQQNQPQPQNGDKGDKSDKNDEKKDAQQNPSQGNPQSPQQNQDGQGEPLKPAPDDANKKREGEIQAGNAQNAQKGDPQQEAAAEAEAAKEGKMTPEQAKTLLESLRGEDERVQLLKPAGKPHEHNFRNW